MIYKIQQNWLQSLPLFSVSFFFFRKSQLIPDALFCNIWVTYTKFMMKVKQQQMLKYVHLYIRLESVKWKHATKRPTIYDQTNKSTHFNSLYSHCVFSKLEGNNKHHSSRSSNVAIAARARIAAGVATLSIKCYKFMCNRTCWGLPLTLSLSCSHNEYEQSM